MTTTKKRGRPHGTTRGNTPPRTIRLSASDWALVQRAADVRGVRLSEVIRGLVREHLK